MTNGSQTHYVLPKFQVSDWLRINFKNKNTGELRNELLAVQLTNILIQTADQTKYAMHIQMEVVYCINKRNAIAFK